MKTLNNQAALNLENLENRVVLDAAAATAQLGDTGILSIQGTRDNDIIRVTDVREGESYAVEMNGSVTAIDGEVSAILFRGNGGQDAFENDTGLISFADANNVLAIQGTPEQDWVEVDSMEEGELTLEWLNGIHVLETEATSLTFEGLEGNDRLINHTELPVTDSVDPGESQNDLTEAEWDAEMDRLFDDLDQYEEDETGSVVEMSEEDWEAEMDKVFEEDEQTDVQVDGYDSELDYRNEDSGSEYEYSDQEAFSEFELIDDQEDEATPLDNTPSLEEKADADDQYQQHYRDEDGSEYGYFDDEDEDEDM